MSTRTIIWTLFVSALLAVLVVFFVARSAGWTDRGPRTEDGQQTTASTALRSPPSVLRPLAPAAWPMFHGGQGLLGRAPGELTDSLAFLWKFKTGDEVKSSPAIAEGRVFVGSSDESIYALDLATGQKLWSYKTGSSVEGAPCVLEGRVFIGSGDNFLYALDAGTGALKWKYETGGQILGSANWTRSPDGQKTWILIGSYDNKVHCVDAQTGKLLWAFETGNYINGSPAVADGRCVFGGCDALIHVVSVADGTKLSEIDSGSYIAGSAAFLDGEVYVGNYGNVFLRADLQTGQTVWKYEKSESPFFSSPAVGDQLVVVGGRDEYVHGIRRSNGQEAWTFKTQGEVNSSPALCGDKVIVGSDDGRLYLLTLAEGKLLWSYEMGQPVTSSPAVAGSMVVVGCDDGCVYAFGPKTAGGSKAR